MDEWRIIVPHGGGTDLIEAYTRTVESSLRGSDRMLRVLDEFPDAIAYGRVRNDTVAMWVGVGNRFNKWIDQRLVGEGGS